MINVTKAVLPPMDEYIKEIAPIWESHWLTNMGEKHQKLEMDLQKYLDVANVTLFTNGHLALESALSACDIKGEVITTPFTFVSTTNAIVRTGSTPVFCDINENDYTIDADKIESLITPKTCAIVPVHVYGNICNVDKIERIAKKYNLKVIYDGAHAFGEKLNGKSIAKFGDATMFSFHATKVFNTIEGGAVSYNDIDLKDKLNYIKNFGIYEDEIVFPGGNAKMSEFQAAMGICNLRHIDEHIARRKIVAQRYIQNLSGASGLKVWKEQQGVEHNYSYFPVIFDGAELTRDAAALKLERQGIHARKYFYPLTNNCQCYNYNAGGTPVAQYFAERVLTLPLYPDLALEDVDRICEIITE